jgi:hypothetical protein
MLILKTLASIAAFILLMYPVYADPSPGPWPPQRPTILYFIDYSIEVLVSEVVAWIVGTEVLLRLLRERKQEVTRVESYKIMLVAMIVSFLIGLLFWKIFGWI